MVFEFVILLYWLSLGGVRGSAMYGMVPRERLGNEQDGEVSVPDTPPRTHRSSVITETPRKPVQRVNGQSSGASSSRRSQRNLFGDQLRESPQGAVHRTRTGQSSFLTDSFSLKPRGATSGYSSDDETTPKLSQHRDPLGSPFTPAKPPIQPELKSKRRMRLESPISPFCSNGQLSEPGTGSAMSSSSMNVLPYPLPSADTYEPLPETYEEIYDSLHGVEDDGVDDPLEGVGKGDVIEEPTAEGDYALSSENSAIGTPDCKEGTPPLKKHFSYDELRDALLESNSEPVSVEGADERSDAPPVAILTPSKHHHTSRTSSVQDKQRRRQALLDLTPDDQIIVDAINTLRKSNSFDGLAASRKRQRRYSAEIKSIRNHRKRLRQMRNKKTPLLTEEIIKMIDTDEDQSFALGREQSVWDEVSEFKQSVRVLESDESVSMIDSGVSVNMDGLPKINHLPLQPFRRYKATASEVAVIKNSIKYAIAPYCPRFYNDKFGYSFFREIYNQTNEIRGFIALNETSRNIIIGFRGSVGEINWQINRQASLLKVSNLGLLHKGYATAFSSISSQYAAAIRDLEKVLDDHVSLYKWRFSGHSMGGALATFAMMTTLDMMGHGLAKNMRVITFGSPRFGNSEFISKIHPNVRYYRVVNGRDPIPGLPPYGITRYVHVPSEYWIRGETVYKCLGTATKENKKCSGSVFLPYSKKDHKDFFGIRIGSRGCSLLPALFEKEK